MGPRGLLAVALALACAALCGSSETAAPSQVRLSLGAAPDEMRVSWQTEGPTAASVVQYTPLAARRRLREAALFPGANATGADKRTATATGAGKRTATGVQWRFEAAPTRSVMLHQVRSQSCAASFPETSRQRSGAALRHESQGGAAPCIPRRQRSRFHRR
jgi:hypothetical protein